MATQTYVPHEWITGELITADKMNNIEGFLTGIQDAFVSNSSEGADVAGQLRFSSATDSSFYKGRDIAAINVNSTDSSGAKYYAINSIKTKTGSWDMGIYDDRLVFNFISDTDYENNTNNFRQFILTGAASTILWENNPFEIITSENWSKYIHLDDTIQADNINAQSINTGLFNIYRTTWPGLSFKESIGSAAWASINYHTGNRGDSHTGPIDGQRYIYFTHWAPGGNQTSGSTFDRDVYYLPAGPTEPNGDHWYAILTTKNNVLSSTAFFSRDGDNSSYVNGRDHAFLRQTRNDRNYRPILSSHSAYENESGTWEIGTYNNGLNFVYVSDTNYQAWTEDSSLNGHVRWALSNTGVVYGGMTFNDAITLKNNFSHTSGSVSLSNPATWRTALGLGTAATAASTSFAAASHNHSAANITSGTLSVARGGTGATTFTSGAVLIGNGTNAVTTRAITPNVSTASPVPYSSSNYNLVTVNTLSYWDGAYNSGGSSNISKVGTITKGIWQGSQIDYTYLKNVAASVHQHSLTANGILKGYVSQADVAANTSQNEVQINFSDYGISEFASQPMVVVGMLASGTSAGLGGCQVICTSVTTTYFKYRKVNNTSNNRTFGITWIAVGQVPMIA